MTMKLDEAIEMCERELKAETAAGYIMFHKSSKNHEAFVTCITAARDAQGLVKEALDELETVIKQEKTRIKFFYPGELEDRIRELRAKYCPKPPKEKPTLKERFDKLVGIMGGLLMIHATIWAKECGHGKTEPR